MYSPRAPTRQGKEPVTFAGKLTVRKAGFGQIVEREGPGLRVQKAPIGEGKRVVPGRGRRWGCQERAGSPQEESREARQEPGRAARGNPGRGRSLGFWDGEE